MDRKTKITAAEDISTNRTYKDSLFRMIFRKPKELLELYNAINDTAYDDPDMLQITTLENAVYMNVKNDVSCLLDMRLQLYEHQSTVNPNMPLRDLMHVSRQFQALVAEKDIYSTDLIPLPTPKFFIFYNGTANQPERLEYRLSDAFEIKEDTPALELIVVQLNINNGFNLQLMQQCPTLWQYMCFVNKVRTYEKQASKKAAVQQAVDECIREDVLREFLLKNKSEVISMCIFEYNEELHEKTLLEKGRSEGKREGKMEHLVSQVYKKHLKGKSADETANELETDAETIQTIYCIIEQISAEDAPCDMNKIIERLIRKLN